MTLVIDVENRSRIIAYTIVYIRPFTVQIPLIWGEYFFMEH